MSWHAVRCNGSTVRFDDDDTAGSIMVRTGMEAVVLSGRECNEL